MVANNGTDYDENTMEDYNGILNSNFVLALAFAPMPLVIVWFPVSVFICCAQWCHCSNEGRGIRIKDRSLTFRTMVALGATILYALVFFGGCYALSYKLYDSIDYMGPMRVTNWTYVEQRRKTDTKQDTAVVFTAHARIQLDWGYKWACPDHNAKVCRTRLDECGMNVCTRKTEKGTCTEEEKEAANQRVSEFANSFFNKTASHQYIPYEAQVGPSKDENWPSIEASGRCGRCDVMLGTYGPEYLKNMRIALGPCYALAFVLAGLTCYIFCWNDEDNEDDETFDGNEAWNKWFGGIPPVTGQATANNNNNNNNNAFASSPPESGPFQNWSNVPPNKVETEKDEEMATRAADGLGSFDLFYYNSTSKDSETQN